MARGGPCKTKTNLIGAGAGGVGGNVESREGSRDALKGDLQLLQDATLGVEVDDGEGVAAGYGLDPTMLKGSLGARGRTGVVVLRHY